MFKVNSNFSVLVIASLLLMNFACSTSSDSTVATSEFKVPLTDIYKEAAVVVIANFQLRLAGQIDGKDYYISPDGSIQNTAREAGFFRSQGSGAIFSDDNQYRIVSARHVVEVSPSTTILNNEMVFNVVQDYFVKNQILRSGASKEEVMSLADIYFEIERAEGFLIPAGTSEISVEDDLSENPNKIPRGGYAYTRKEQGDVHDFAVLAPKDPIGFKPEYSFTLDDLANKEDILQIMDSNPPKDIYCASFPKTEELSFSPETSKGILNKYDGESLNVTLNYITHGSSGAALISAEEVLGLVWRFDKTTDRKQVAVPAPIIEVKLRESFK